MGRTMKTPPQHQKGVKHDWVPGEAARCRDELIELNRQYKERTGTDWYLYTSRPGDGQTRVVFQDGVRHGYQAGLRHMQSVLARLDMKRPASPDEVYQSTLDNLFEGESSGDVEAPTGWFARVRWEDGLWYLIQHDTLGFTHMPYQGESEQVVKDAYELLEDEYAAWDSQDGGISTGP